MALPTISREAVAKVLDLAPHIDTVTAMAGPVEPHPDLRTIVDTLDETGSSPPSTGPPNSGIAWTTSPTTIC